LKTFRRAIRLIQINYILARYGLDEIILSLHLLRPLRFIIYFNPWNWGVNKNLTQGERLRMALVALGPIFVKLGQTLSTRRDLLPEDIADELAKLQDKVPPFPSSVVLQILQETYKRPVGEVFAEFEPTALASASIAQVHTAKLWDGKDVVVKVLRPRILKQIQQDVDLMYLLARFAERYYSDAKRLKPVAVVAEFEQTLLDELNLQREAANASQLRRNFLNSPMLYIPEVYWDYIRRNVLVTERIYGIPVSNIESLKAHNINLKVLAERGVEIFFTQVFRDCFFHADMHPGNIFVSPKNPEDPQYLGVDFGIMGSLSPEDQFYLAENLVAFFNRNYRRVAEIHIASGWVPQDTRVEEFEAAIRTVCEPIFERPLRDISFGHLLLNLFTTARRFNMQIQPQLVLLQKTLFNIEGLGRQLYPDLDLWNTAKPFIEKWLKRQLGVRAMVRKIQQNAPYWAEKLPDMPEFLFKVIQEWQVNNRNKQLQDCKEKKNFLTRKMRFSNILFGVGSALVAFAIINGFANQHWLDILEHIKLSWVLGLIGLLLLIFARRQES